MALLRSGRATFLDAGILGGQYQCMLGNFIRGGLRNRFLGGFSQTFGGYNNGASHPSSFILPGKAGSISSYNSAQMALALTNATIIPAMPMVASSAFVLSVTNAQLDQVVQLIANGVLALTGNAALAAAVSMQASSAMSLAASALAGGIFPIEASSSMALSPSVTLIAKAFMEASAGGPTPLSPEGLANAVLDALLADHNTSGTVGEALNNVGASSNPWSADLTSNNTAGTFGERVQKLLTKNQINAILD